MLNIFKKIPFILWFLFVLSAAGTIFPGYILYQSYQTLNWPHTGGLITQSSITEIKRENDDKNKEIRYFYTYENKIAYIYEVDGQLLRNDNSNSLNGAVVEYPNKDDAMKIKNQFSKGKVVKVFYNPDNPSDSVLIPTVLYFMYGFMGVFGLLLIISICVMFYIASGKRKPETHASIEQTL
ncbi:DUF3592 domain-containing protein [Vibrio sp.]|nr:DUF3592 domain-containing protein [Vibrio sp.]